MARVMVFYDISSDALRRRVHQACLDQGLEPWQASVFMGELSAGRRRELEARLSTLMRGQVGKVHVQPIGAVEVGRAWIRH